MTNGPSSLPHEPACFSCPVSTYQQFTPAHDSGWRRQVLTFSRRHTALVVMHAIEPPSEEQFPGWFRAVPYLNRSREVLQEAFPPLLAAVRQAGLPVFHVPGLEPSPVPSVPTDPTWRDLQAFRALNVFPGEPNLADVDAGWSARVIAANALPQPGEAIAESSADLHALASAHGINHLIYIGFALNWCLLMSPAGMVDMKRLGYLCSTVREGVATVEPGSLPHGDQEIQSALWRVAVEFGFIFSQADLVNALSA